jgi:hypothetical protein
VLDTERLLTSTERLTLRAQETATHG